MVSILTGGRMQEPEIAKKNRPKYLAPSVSFVPDLHAPGTYSVVHLARYRFAL